MNLLPITHIHKIISKYIIYLKQYLEVEIIKQLIQSNHYKHYNLLRNYAATRCYECYVIEIVTFYLSYL